MNRLIDWHLHCYLPDHRSPEDAALQQRRKVAGGGQAEPERLRAVVDAAGLDQFVIISLPRRPDVHTPARLHRRTGLAISGPRGRLRQRGPERPRGGGRVRARRHHPRPSRAQDLPDLPEHRPACARVLAALRDRERPPHPGDVPLRRRLHRQSRMGGSVSARQGGHGLPESEAHRRSLRPALHGADRDPDAQERERVRGHFGPGPTAPGSSITG